MRLVGTAATCVLVAFGAAFLISRAADHPAPARAATTTARTTRVVTPKPTRRNTELVSEFAPVRASLKPKPRRRHVTHHSSPAPTQPAPTYTAPQATPAPVYPAPAPTTPAYTPPSATPPSSSGSGSSGGSSHKHSSGGSGTTTIG